MNPKDVQKVAIIGGGTMGHSIAQVFAQAGIEVNLMDVKAGVLEQALRRMKGNLQTLADYGKVEAKEIPYILGRVRTSTDIARAAKGVDFALETVVEIPEIKKKVFSQLEEACPPECRSGQQHLRPGNFQSHRGQRPFPHGNGALVRALLISSPSSKWPRARRLLRKYCSLPPG